jgi:hypothetical protein
MKIRCIFCFRKLKHQNHCFCIAEVKALLGKDFVTDIELNGADVDRKSLTKLDKSNADSQLWQYGQYLEISFNRPCKLISFELCAEQCNEFAVV